jgi:hypothetical protein
MHTCPYVRTLLKDHFLTDKAARSPTRIWSQKTQTTLCKVGNHPNILCSWISYFGTPLCATTQALSYTCRGFNNVLIPKGTRHFDVEASLGSRHGLPSDIVVSRANLLKTLWGFGRCFESVTDVHALRGLQARWARGASCTHTMGTMGMGMGCIHILPVANILVEWHKSWFACSCFMKNA